MHIPEKERVMKQVFKRFISTLLALTLLVGVIPAAVAAENPVYYDILPLSLEEIFIYELGGVNYEVKNIIL